MLKAYIVDTDVGSGFDENYLVYHETEEAARELGRGHMTSGPSYSDTRAVRAPEHDARAAVLTEPEVEDDPEYLRDKGWGYEGERSCDSCGLKPFGLEKYAICSSSNQCRECGCNDDPVGAEGPCTHEEGFEHG